MARRSLRPNLNQIRTWVRQGRTDAWIAHQLEVTVQQIEAFKKDNDLVPDDDGQTALGAGAPAGADDEDEDDDRPKKRRRGRRGGRARKSKGAVAELEGTFDHGEEGYGLWLDPAVADNPVYAEHWAGHRPVTVTIEEDQIVIRRAGEDGDAH